MPGPPAPTGTARTAESLWRSSGPCLRQPRQRRAPGAAREARGAVSAALALEGGAVPAAGRIGQRERRPQNAPSGAYGRRGAAARRGEQPGAEPPPRQGVVRGRGPAAAPPPPAAAAAARPTSERGGKRRWRSRVGSAAVPLGPGCPGARLLPPARTAERPPARAPPRCRSAAARSPARYP